MKSHPRISELLVQTEGFKDVPPVLLTSGEIGIYYVNTEKLAQDNGEFNQYGEDSEAMVAHAVRMTKAHPTFGEVIKILAERAKSFMDFKGAKYLISGGQRRDWLFSGPVAIQLGMPHASVYKDGRVEILDASGKTSMPLLAGATYEGDLRAIHISDLLTEGSSCFSVEGGQEIGWIPWLRRKNIKVKDLITVVTRLQGGERNLAHQGVYTDAQVAIDEDFLRANSQNPKRVVIYQRNPRLWSEAYLTENGALAFVDAFNPKAKKDDRALKFLARYGQVLKDAGKFEELEKAVREKHGVEIK
jgi:orotate phosphoribosyltransferase